MSEELIEKDEKIIVDPSRRIKAEPKVPLNILWAIDSLERDDGPSVWFHYLRYFSKESGHQFSVVSLKDGPMRSEYERLCSVHLVSETQEAITSKITTLNTELRFDVAFVSSVENTWFPEVLE